MWSLESGGESDIVFDVKAPLVRGRVLRERLAIGRMHEVKKAGTDFVR